MKETKEFDRKSKRETRRSRKAQERRVRDFDSLDKQKVNKNSRQQARDFCNNWR